MQNLTRRSLVLKGAAGLAAASSVAALPAEAKAALPDAPFRIEPTERFLEIRRQMKVLSEVDMYENGAAFADAWNKIILMQRQISRTPRTPAELLEYATITPFWNTAKADGGLDPCEALMRQREHRDESYLPEQTAMDLAMAVFGLAGYRATSFTPWVYIRSDPDDCISSARPKRQTPAEFDDDEIESDEV
jgi:hypothetical protein